MSWTIALILMILWALGMLGSYTMGGFLHILLAVSIIILIFRFIQGRKVIQ